MKESNTQTYHSVHLASIATSTALHKTGAISVGRLFLKRRLVVLRSSAYTFTSRVNCWCVSVCLCVSASISLEMLDRSARNFVCGSAVAVARSSSGGVALRYVLPVLWMTSRSAVMGATNERCIAALSDGDQ